MVSGSAESGSTVKLYTNDECLDPEATGTAAAFASPGLAISVSDGSSSTFYAKAIDAAGNASACSTDSVAYVEDSTPPARPSGLSVSPASPANDNAPMVSGSAESGSTVRLYTSSACSGTVAATGTAAAFASPGLAVSVGDNSSTTFHATATDAAGNASACSTSSVAYTEDSSGPATTDDVPAGYVAHDVTVTLTAADSGAGVDKTYYTTGTSPGDPDTSSPVYDAADKPVLRDGESIRYFSTDQLGNREAVNASRAAQVDATAPETRFESSYTSAAGDVTFRFGASDPAPSSGGLTYRGRLDSDAYQPCTSPKTFAGVAAGEHGFDVMAADAVGNEDASPAHFTLTVGGTAVVGTVTDPSGGMVSTDPDSTGPTAADPFQADVTTPVAGTVTITETTPTGEAPIGFAFLGHQFVIEAPAGTESAPLKLVFKVASTALPAGATAQNLMIHRNGSSAADCTGSGTATPDPCVSERRTLPDGSIAITVLAVHASTWTLAAPTPTAVTPASTTPATSKPDTSTPLVISRLGVNHRCVRAGRGGVAFSFTLSQDAWVRYDIMRRVHSPVWSVCSAHGRNDPDHLRRHLACRRQADRRTARHHAGHRGLPPRQAPRPR